MSQMQRAMNTRRKQPDNDFRGWLGLILLVIASMLRTVYAILIQVTI